MKAKGGNRKFSKLTAMRLIFGLSREEAAACYRNYVHSKASETTIRALESDANPYNDGLKELYNTFYNKIAYKNYRGKSAGEVFNDLVGAMQQVTPTSLIREKKMTKRAAFRIALGLSEAAVGKLLNVSRSTISCAEMNSNKTNNDGVLQKIDEALTEVYSSLSEEEQRQVELREEAILLMRFPHKNPFRAVIDKIVKELMGSQEEAKTDIPETIEYCSKDVEVTEALFDATQKEEEVVVEQEPENGELKTTIKELEGELFYARRDCKELENELNAERGKVFNLEDEIERLKEINSQLAGKLHAREYINPDYIKQLEDSVKYLEKRARNAEQEVDRLRKEAHDIQSVTLDAPDIPNNMVFNNCNVTINITRKEDV